MNLFEEKLLNLFGSYKDFPKPGIVFCDILPVLRDRDIFAELIESMVKSDSLSNSDAIVAIDARGFIFASIFAHRTRNPLVLARKKGKLPPPTKSKEYQLEYNTATLEIKSDAISKDDRVIIIDDLMATGGTMNAAIDIVQELGGKIIACACIMDLTFLPGSTLIKDRNIPFYAGVEYS